mgnify:CR=1 FL=1
MPGCIGFLNESVDNLSSAYLTKSELKAVFEEFHHSAGLLIEYNDENFRYLFNTTVSGISGLAIHTI